MIATADVQAWLEGIAPIVGTSKVQSLGQLQSSKGDVQKMEQGLKAGKGLITIVEALRLLQDETGERFPELLAAVHADEINAYAPGRYKKPIPGNPSDRARLPRGVVCGDDQLEFFGSDLDAWLDKHFPRVNLRFSQASESRDTIWNNEITCIMRELSLNDAPVDWDHWRQRGFYPHKAAELAHCVKPDTIEPTKELKRKIQRLAESLAEHSTTWTLSELVKHLGDKAPFNMKRAAASGSIAAAKVGAGDTARDKEDSDDEAGHTETRPDETPPVTAEVVMKAFPTVEWGCSLSKVSETKYQWLNPAVRYKGSPRPGDAKRFSLARVALCLVLGPKKFPRNAAAAIIKKHPEWLPEWESLSDDWLAS